MGRLEASFLPLWQAWNHTLPRNFRGLFPLVQGPAAQVEQVAISFLQKTDEVPYQYYFIFKSFSLHTETPFFMQYLKHALIFVKCK